MRQPADYCGSLAALIDTEHMARRILAAQGVVREALDHCPDMSISLSGGKDSVAAAIVARSVKRDMPIVVATPPNALPYRAEHMRALKDHFGGPWTEVGYDWPVDRVLDRLAVYPAGLKIRTLTGLRLPGFVLGLRVAEGRQRMMTYRQRGAVYETATGWRCLPIALWSAEEVVGLAAYFGAPIAEVYRKPLLGMRLDDIRDGTWWAHSTRPEIDDWMRRNYGEQHPYWMRSAEISLAERRMAF